jgi:hypothetical protein
MWRSLSIVRTDISEQRVAYIFKVEKSTSDGQRYQSASQQLTLFLFRRFFYLEDGCDTPSLPKMNPCY